MLSGQPRQFQEWRRQFLQHAGALRIFIAGMQCGQLDRYPRGLDAVAARLFTDSGDRIGIGVKEPVRVSGGHCRFSQHVVGVQVTLRLRPVAAPQRLLDGLTEYELPPYDFHSLGHRNANQRLATACGEPLQQRRNIVSRTWRQIDQSPGKHQSPGGCVHEYRCALSEMLVPMTDTELFANQAITGVGIGDAQ